MKQTVMTSVYGVTFVGARQQVLARLQDVVEDLLDAPGRQRRRNKTVDGARRHHAGRRRGRRRTLPLRVLRGVVDAGSFGGVIYGVRDS